MSFFLILWIILIVIFLVVEAFTEGVLAVWFAIAALISAVIEAVFPGAYIAEFVVFIICSLIFSLLGSFVFKLNQKDAPNSKPVYSILGKTAIVTKPITKDIQIGQISINGDVWSAITLQDEEIPENAKVIINDIQGVKAVVSLIK